MNNWIVVPAALAGAISIATCPLYAQQEGGLSAAIEFSQRFETGDNLGLDVPDEGRTNLATTSLGFNLQSVTSTQSLSLFVGGVLRVGDVASGTNISTGFADPRFNLGYSREGYNSLFEISGRFRQSDVDFLRSLSDFENDDGVIELPEDFDDLTGNGKRNYYSFSTSLETGRANPLGFIFEASMHGTEYGDGASASLTDNMRAQASITSLLRMSPASTGRIVLGFDRYEDDDILNTQRDTHSIKVGYETELANATLIDAELGYEEVETKETIGTTSRSGMTGRLGIEREMTNGSVDASITSTLNYIGDRMTFQAGRDLELPNGKLAFSAGATSLDGDDPDVIGSLRWDYDLPRSTFTARFDRTISSNSDDEERIASIGEIRFNQQINQISSLEFSATYGLSESTPTSNRVRQTSLTASYNRELTERWGYQIGANHRIRDESTVGRADSTSIFFLLQSSLDLLN